MSNCNCIEKLTAALEAEAAYLDEPRATMPGVWATAQAASVRRLAARLAPATEGAEEPGKPAPASTPAATGPYTVRDRIWIDGPNLPSGAGIYGGPDNEATTWCQNLNNAHAAGRAEGDAAGYARGKAEQLRELCEKLARSREGFHRTYNGGHHDEKCRDAFHHGMDTVFNWLEQEGLPQPAAPDAKEAGR